MKRGFLKLLGLLLLASLAGKASANLIFNWSGACGFGCTGTATAELVTTDTYSPGDALNATTFVSFEYSSSSATIVVPGTTNAIDFRGGVPAALPGEALQFIIDFTSNDTIFCAPDGGQGSICNPNGWHMIYAPLQINEGSRATAGTWNGAPEPGTLALLGLGLAGLAATRRRRQ